MRPPCSIRRILREHRVGNFPVSYLTRVARTNTSDSSNVRSSSIRISILSMKPMKTKTFLALFLCALAASVIAQAPATYTAAEAAKHVGETATVTDRVDGVHQSGKGNIFLNMGGKYPNQAFTAFIPSSGAAQFSNPQQ